SYKKTITLGLDYSEFEGGIKQCNSAMKNLDAEFKLASTQMEKTGTKADKLGLKEEYLGQKINVQQQKVEEAKKKYNALMDAHADTSKIEAADRALLKERTTLQQLENEFIDTELAQSKFKENAAALSAVVIGIGAALFDCAKGAAQYADDLATLSAQTGVSTDNLQKLDYASEFVDVSLETMSAAMARVTKDIEKAGDSSTDLGAIYKQLGVSVTESNGQLKSSEQIFYDLIDSLGKIQNQTERDNIAMSLFGKNAQDLAGVISAGSVGLKEYGDEAERVGLIMSEEEINKGLELSDAMQKLNDTFDAVKNNLGMTVIPILTALFEAIANIPAPVISTIAIIVGLITTVVLLTKTVNSTIKAAEGIGKLISRFTGLTADPLMIKIAGITALVIALVAAITALIAAIAVLRGKSQDLQASMNSIGGAIGSGNSAVGMVGHNASGTQSWRGGLTWVGETGPELVDIPRGSRIYNNRESEAMVGGDTYNINMNCDLSKMRSVSDVVDAVQNIGLSAGRGRR
ncbi:MAG: hypothetical protein KBT06_03025, partial [Prevotellaceae bacterium]|nr:hypothetical protein [Candidatus Colivivens equi]